MPKSDFNGQRLQKARILRGLTIVELAGKMTPPISKQAISQYENNKNAPEIEKIMQLAHILHFPIGFFYESDLVEVKTNSTYFRALASTSKKERASQEERTEIVARLYKIISDYIEFPILNLPTDDISDLPISEVASILRDCWGLGSGPIKNLVFQMEKNGIIVTSLPTGSEKIDAHHQVCRIDDKDYVCVVLGSQKESASRRQFCAAHELGHILLHDQCDVEMLPAEEFRQKEQEANNFAAELLLPKDAFLHDLSLRPFRLEVLIELKRKWHVSMSAMLMRAKDLDFISYEKYQSLFRQLSARGWKTQEPLDNIIVKDNPQVLSNAINVLLENDIFTKTQLVQEICDQGFSMFADDIEEFLNLKKGILSNPSNTQANVIQLFPKYNAE